MVVAGSPPYPGGRAGRRRRGRCRPRRQHFFRHDRIASSYLADLRKQMAAQREAQIADLAADLKEIKANEASAPARADLGQDRGVPGRADGAALSAGDNVRALLGHRRVGVSRRARQSACDLPVVEVAAAIDEKYLRERLASSRRAQDEHRRSRDCRATRAGEGLHERVKARWAERACDGRARSRHRGDG